MVAKGTSAKQHYGFISMSLLLLLCLGGCGKQQVAQQQISLEPEEEQALFETVTVDYGDVTLSQKIQCTYRQVEDQEVCFTVSGRIIDRIYVSVGDMVHKGDLLAELSRLHEQVLQVMQGIAQALWPSAPLPGGMGELVEMLKGARQRFRLWKIFACRQGAREVWAMVKT